MKETTENYKAVYCDTCGHCMTDEKADVRTSIAFQLEVQGEHSEHSRVKETFGKTQFDICWVCCIKSFGVKPTILDKNPKIP